MSYLRMLKLISAVCILSSGVCLANTRVLVPGGEYTSPLDVNKKIKVSSFYLDSLPAVSSSKNVKTQVSWFEAQSDCLSRGGRLPTTDEWELAASFGEDEERILARYSKPSAAYFKAGMSRANRLGIHDLLGLVWEWTEDFNAQTITAGDDRFFCGGAAVKAKDPAQYSVFMRFAYRSSLKPTYQARNLGYRCAYDLKAVEKAKVLPSDSIYNLNAEWIKSTGEKIKTDDLAGKFRLFVMVYTRCKTVCPMLTTYMKKLERELPGDIKNKIRFTLVSFDTERDKPEELSEFKNQYRLSDGWDLIVGDKLSTRWLAQQLEVVYKKQADDSFEHSGIVSVIDPNGVVLSQLLPSDLSRESLEKALKAKHKNSEN